MALLRRACTASLLLSRKAVLAPMSSSIACPQCGEAEDLAGAPSPEGIRIRCERCGTEWLRDKVTHVCATCGGSDLETRPRALTQYSRGNQLSIVGFDEIWLCCSCDEEILEWSKTGRAIPFAYRSAAMEKRDECDTGQGGSDVRITP